MFCAPYLRVVTTTTAKTRVRGKNSPRFDRKERELWVGGKLVKRFRQPAAAQEAVLLSFEELGWPAWMDDPLPHLAGKDPKARLHETIENLNRHQKNHLIRFFGDGTGTKVGWELIE